MHNKPMSELSGTFSPPEEEKYCCRKCEQREAICRMWESSCGGYEDYKYVCLACNYTWWVEGADS